MKDSDKIYLGEDSALMLSSRIRNLMWTISGDYNINFTPDLSLFEKSADMCLYDAIKQGAFAKYYDREELNLYIVKKLYFEADYNALSAAAQMAVEAACKDKIEKERAGVGDIKKQALSDILEYDFNSLNNTLMGRMKLELIRAYNEGTTHIQNSMKPGISAIMQLEGDSSTMDVIKAIDYVYNNYFDKTFEKKHGGLDAVLAVSMDELGEYDWSDYLKDEAYADQLEQVIKKVNAAVTNLSSSEGKNKAKAKTGVIRLSEQDVAMIKTHVENNFGKSALSIKETQRLERTLCRGMHLGCHLHITKGLIKDADPTHYRYKYALLQAQKNRMIYFDNHRIVKRNITRLIDILKNALMLQTENETAPADMGQIVVNRLWKIGRTDPKRIFERVIKHENMELVVDVLIDASGSQSSRQGKVALQGYILAQSLCALNIPCRITSFCSFWEYTVLRLFRDYDSPISENSSLFEYMTSSNNRDGLAIRAVLEDLKKRTEDNKILIVLSDGRPNDMNVNDKNVNDPSSLYTGKRAIDDTALAVREARREGIKVLGVFAGEEADLEAEKLIFGKDFAYIKNIANFSAVTGGYLKRRIED